MRTNAYRLLAVGLATGTLVALANLPASAAVLTEQLTVTPFGRPANNNSGNIDITPPGRFAVFRSDANNLVPGDFNAVGDVFLRDRISRQTERISVSSTGQQGNQSSGAGTPAVTPNGRYVAFDSLASNLVAGDTNGQSDVFLRDRRNKRTTRISVGLHGVQANGVSEGGSISADGQRVAFGSTASNLVRGDTNQQGDVFVRDRRAGVTTLVSVGTGGAPANGPSHAPALSADGRLVAFESRATNLVPVDPNPLYTDVFVRDLGTGTTEIISVTTDGQRIFGSNLTPSISADGRYVVFMTQLPIGAPGGPWSQVWLRDRVAKTTTRVVVDPAVAPGRQFSYAGSVSPDGRHVAFLSAENTPTGGRNPGVYLLDVATGKTSRVSVTPSGTPATGTFRYVAAADNGVAFGAQSPDLVPHPGAGMQLYFRPS
jgi:Tol biopolymer transport system component